MSSFSPFERAHAYLLSTIGETLSPRTSYKLDRMRALLAELGDPHRAYPVVHIGGTSGKTSTSTMVASILQAAGHTTGLHTKPHLHSMTERARVDGAEISQERFAELFEEMLPAFDRVTPEYGRPTYYEALLALAFLHFARERVAVAVIEVGLGGRLDGTNVVEPEVAAITSVGFDHTDVLGDTIEAIAREKGGIAKRGVQLVVAASDPAALRVLTECALAAGAPMVRVRDVVSMQPMRAEPPLAQAFEAITASNRYRVRLTVHGLFQRENAATAIAIVERLRTSLQPSADAVERGLSAAAIPGRMEMFADGGVTLVYDIAHNVEKASYLAASLRDLFPDRRIVYVLAVGESKDAPHILEQLATAGTDAVTTRFSTEGRTAVDAHALAAMARSAGMTADAVEPAADAFATARRRATSGDVVVVTGSTFLVAELRDAWLRDGCAASGAH
ncbi:MAG TPA: folylpolyglutamate synthase/dihydrofolate synthase family protein [Candidatus Tumulicola sp.]|jgi:dihydrofolate synthase/folylpolyglutamate synthase